MQLVLQGPIPPAISTFPFERSVAVGSLRATDMLPVAVKVPALGSYSSAVLEASQLPQLPRHSSRHQDLSI